MSIFNSGFLLGSCMLSPTKMASIFIAILMTYIIGYVSTTPETWTSQMASIDREYEACKTNNVCGDQDFSCLMPCLENGLYGCKEVCLALPEDNRSDCDQCCNKKWMDGVSCNPLESILVATTTITSTNPPKTTKTLPKSTKTLPKSTTTPPRPTTTPLKSDTTPTKSDTTPTISDTTQPKPTTTPPKSTTTPPKTTCPKNYDAIFYYKSSDETYVVDNDKVYILNKTLGIRTGPLKLELLFPGIDSVDAAYVNEEGNIVFFKGDQYYIYDKVSNAQRLEEGSINEKFKVNVTKVDAAFFWSGSNKVSGRAYLFVGEKYYRYDEQTQMIDNAFPNNMIYSGWHKVPNDVDAGFVWKDGKIYFLNDSKFYQMVVNTNPRHVAGGYPKEMGEKVEGSCFPEISPAVTVKATLTILLTLFSVFMTTVLR